MLIELDISMKAALTVLRREVCNWKHRRATVCSRGCQDVKIGRCLCVRKRRDKREDRLVVVRLGQSMRQRRAQVEVNKD